MNSKKKQKEKLDKILIDPNIQNPFPGRPATATAKRPPVKLIGRDKSLTKLQKIIQNSVLGGQRPLLIIEGETGMGKSALTAVLFNKIKDKKLNVNGSTHYTAFIEAYGEIDDYNLKLFLFQIFSSLESHQTLRSIVANIVQLIATEIIKNRPEHQVKLYKKITDDESLKTVLSILNDRNEAENFIKDLFLEIQYIYYELSNKWENFDGSFLYTLICSQASTRERMSALSALTMGSKFHEFKIATEGIAKKILHSFMGLLVGLNQKTSFTIFIDQLEELFKVEKSKQMSNQFSHFCLHCDNSGTLFSSYQETSKLTNI